MRVTELRQPDLGNGFLESLKSLSRAKKVMHLAPGDAKWILRIMRRENNRATRQRLAKPYHIFVAKDGQDVGATTTLFVHESWYLSNGIFTEIKFIHSKVKEWKMNLGKVAHLGDIPVMIQKRKSRASPCRVLEAAIDEALQDGCYKTIVDCESRESQEFFIAFCFVEKEVAMRHKDFKTKRGKFPKLIGHIEDVARIRTKRKNEEKRWKGSGRLVVQAAIDRAKEIGCEELVLECEENLVPYYESLGFERRGVEMRLDLEIGKEPIKT